MGLNFDPLNGLAEDKFFSIYARQCDIEGLTPAVKHPETGEVFVGKNHRVAYDNRREHLPDEGKTLKESRDKGARLKYKQGYVDKDGEFLTRDEIEKLHGFRYSESGKDVEL